MQDLLLGREQTLCKMGGKVFPDHLSLKSEALTCVPSDSSLPQSSVERTAVLEISPKVKVSPCDQFDRWGPLSSSSFH